MKTPGSEIGRQTVHMAMGGFAFLLRVLTVWQAAACALAALAFNLYVLPRIGGRALYRASDRARGYPLGIVLYPAAVLALILVFRERPDIAAASWAILAFGDGAATLGGRAMGGRALAWNRDKTLAGLVSFVVAGGAAGVALAWWTAPVVAAAPGPLFLTAAPLAAATVAALVETVPVRLDDNLSVPAAAAGTLWTLSLLSAPAFDAALPSLVRLAGPAIAVNALVAAAGWRARTVTWPGALTGWAIGTVVFAAAGWQGWTLLLAAFLTATITTRLGLRRKVLLGIAEERGGRRGPGNALANTGLAAAAAVVAAASPHRDLALLALTAALAAGASDTVASEIGKAWGRHTFLVTSLTRVPPGTSGAISWEGTAAGVAAAILLALAGFALGLVPGTAVLIVAAAAIFASFVESALGATLEAPGVLNNDLLNFLNTVCAAVVAVVLARAGH